MKYGIDRVKKLRGYAEPERLSMCKPKESICIMHEVRLYVDM